MKNDIGRREFLRRSGACVVAGLASCSVAHDERRIDEGPERSGLRITTVRAFEVREERWKVVGKNSRLPTHGKFATDRVIQVETSSGVTGFGSSFASEEEAARLIGKDPLSFYIPGEGIHGPLGAGDAPLWDLAGKILDQPVWQLLGARGEEWVPVYDGSIYFSDLEPEHAGNEIGRIIDEVERSLENGHRSFKIKVGRGFKWMEKEAGFARDIEVVRAIRERVGPDIRLMVDANNGYDLETTKRFLEAVDSELFFVEEMFPEVVEEDLELKAWLRDRGRKTLVADGESAGEIDHFLPFIEARALDVLQADIRRFGLTRLLALSRLSAPAGIFLAPHNWGSRLGLYMQLVLARGIENFLLAEEDPADTAAFVAPDLEFRDGRMRFPASPGMGLEFRPEAAGASVRQLWEV